jgi:hypothetical protein
MVGVGDSGIKDASVLRDLTYIGGDGQTDYRYDDKACGEI